MNEIARKIAEASEALGRAETARKGALAAGVAAVRALESALVAALEGGHLRGLKNLGTHSQPFAGARVHGEIDAKIPLEGVAEDAAPAYPSKLCVGADGRLVKVRYWRRLPERDPRGTIMIEREIVTAMDGDLLPDDAEHLTSRLVVVLARHMELSKAAEGRYERLEALAERIQGALVAQS